MKCIRKLFMTFICITTTSSIVWIWISGSSGAHNRPLGSRVRNVPSSRTGTHNLERYTNTERPTGEKSHVEVCTTLSNLSEQATSNDPMKKKSVMYCPITKIASTFTRGLLGRIPKCKKPGLCLESEVGKNGMPSKDTFSFMWVRDPYERIFSAYENKLFNPGDFWKKLGRQIIIRTRKNPAAKSVELGYDVTFNELVHDILSMTANGEELNIHLTPIHQVCNVCELRMDFIGRLETFDADVNHLCNQLQNMDFLTDMKSQAPCNNTSNEWSVYRRVSTLFNILKEYAAVLTPKDQFELMLRTWRTSQFRGFISKHIEMPFSKKDVQRITPKMYRNALDESIQASTNVTELKIQRREALLQAYATVPMNELVLLKEFVKRDCQLFGYSEEPADIFHRTYDPSFDYFAGLL